MKKTIMYKCEICGKVFTGEDEFTVSNECEVHEFGHESPYEYNDCELKKAFGFAEDYYPETSQERKVYNTIPVMMKYGKGSKRPTVLYVVYFTEEGTPVKIAYRNANPNVIAEGKIKEEEEEDEK